LTAAIRRVLYEIPRLQDAVTREFAEYGAKVVHFADETANREYVLEPIDVSAESSAHVNALLSQIES
jgi:hypothetical protein